MVTITQNQAKKRFLTIPPSLQDAIFSVQTAEIIARIGEDNNLDDARAEKLSEAVGWVLLGFMHPEDLAKELQENANVPAQAAAAIANSVAAKIFSPLKSEIEKTYAPLPHEDEADAPKMIQDISMPTSAPSPAKPAPQASSQTFNAPMSVGMKPNQAIPAVPPKPQTPEKGWSRTTSSEPVVKFAPMQQTPPPAPKPSAPAPQPPSFQAKPAPSTASMGIGGEFERLEKTQNAPKDPAPTPPATTPTPAPAPVILHEDPQFKTIKSSSDFRISMPSQENIIGSSSQKTPTPPKAVLEFGKAATPSTPEVSKVVHYTEYGKSPAANTPMPPQPSNVDRHVTELTGQKPGFASVPVPIPPPPSTPKPPASPTPPQEQKKVITKDYI